MATYNFGTAQVQGKADWLVQSASKANTANEAQALDNQGEPAAVKFYGKQTERQFEVIIPADESSFPEIGDVFTYENEKYYVSSVNVTRTNTDFERYSLGCKRYVTAGLPA